MKLTNFSIEDFRQFKDFRLEFTDPASGTPLEKVCFIGPNGTGKSTLLRLLAREAWGTRRDKPAIPGAKDGIQLMGGRTSTSVLAQAISSRTTALNADEVDKQLVVWCPSDTEDGRTEFSGIPLTSLGNALADTTYPFEKHVVTLAEAKQFWTYLVGHIKQREQRLREFQLQPDNRRKAIEDVDREFDADNPQVLGDLAEVWNRILNLADLEFDRDSVEIPIQLTDNLKAYVRTKTRKTRVPYEQLSSGIRHYIFRLGHIRSLYFNRPPGDSILLVDEPEGSLYPDFLYDIVENYREVAPGCQLFMATHSPIVASQFKPEERFILTFGDDGYVTARRGVSPEGDDPNDLLYKDFGVRNLMPEAGQKKWEEFLELRRRIPITPAQERLPLVEECAKIGYDYNFPLNGT